jgi:cytochrome b pre-mRNA-processing protein 3
VGDLAVPKKIQKMGSVFYGLLAAINEAMDKKDEAALSEILRRNLFDGAEVSGLGQICAYVWRQDAAIAALAYADIADGKLALENA